MYSFQNVEIQSKEELNTHVDDENIMLYYFGEFKLDSAYFSPFRKESGPSFYISYYKGSLKWRDFGLSNNPRNAVEFVATLYNLSIRQALNRIYQDIIVNKKHKPIEGIKTAIGGNNREELKYGVRISSLQGWQLDYWTKVGITEDILKTFKVHWCKELWYNGAIWSRGSMHNLMYFYNHARVPYEESWTVYRPLSKDPTRKFRKHNINNHIMGLEYLPQTGNILVITKSYKDIMLLYSLNIPAISPHNENVPIGAEVIEDLKSRFKYIYVNYDNDETGVRSSIEFTKKYNLNYWNIPKSLNCKDPFECAQKLGSQIVRDLFNEKLKRDGDRGLI